MKKKKNPNPDRSPTKEKAPVREPGKADEMVLRGKKSVATEEENEAE